VSVDTVRGYDDPAEAFEAARAFLLARPVEHNVILTVLHDRIARPEPGGYWTVRDGGDVVGFAFQSPRTFHVDGVRLGSHPALDGGWYAPRSRH
jgi:hypothetical protein